MSEAMVTISLEEYEKMRDDIKKFKEGQYLVRCERISLPWYVFDKSFVAKDKLVSDLIETNQKQDEFIKKLEARIFELENIKQEPVVISKWPWQR